jgi:DegT/DnrJ/EryC1/StrS aminotransferase family
MRMPMLYNIRKRLYSKILKRCFYFQKYSVLMVKSIRGSRLVWWFKIVSLRRLNDAYMRPLQMVDTKTQYHKIKTEVDAAVLAVMESSQFIGGKEVASFAENLAKYHSSKHVIPCANGTDALQIAMMALGLQPGDEVITPSFTYIATVEVAALLGIKPIFVEVDKKTFCIDASVIEKAITPKTKAIVPVHLYGHAANMEAIMQHKNTTCLLLKTMHRPLAMIIHSAMAA